MGILVFFLTTIATVAAVVAIWVGASFAVGGSDEGAFLASPFLAIFFLPLLLAAPVVGYLAARATSTNTANAPLHIPRAPPSTADVLTHSHASISRVTKDGVELALLRAELEIATGAAIGALCPACQEALVRAPAVTPGRALIMCPCNACRREIAA